MFKSLWKANKYISDNNLYCVTNFQDHNNFLHLATSVSIDYHWVPSLS